ncbi:MAG: S8 family peptidase [Lachnospiraceae bacterium]|nr:S8 family peptidase [Lachnospiraceae bacterium]
MSQHQDAIYANDRIDLILPYGKIDEEFYQQIIAPYEPTVINDQFVVIHIPIRPNGLLENIRFVYSLVPNLYVPLDTTSLEVSGILQTQNQPGLNLHGKNVLLGFVDTGINYTHPAFLSADGQTRIVEIWDQTVPSSTGDGPFGYGTVYTAEQIQEAVNLENPLSLVPVTDPEGHGTFIAGVAAGSENRQQEFIGAANEAQIAAVKLKEAKQPLQNFYFYSGEKPVYQENDIMTGIQYLVELAERLQLPLVLCLALGSNQGDHMGYTPLDLTLRRLDTVPGIVCVTAAGNEAGKAHHYLGNVTGYTQPTSVEILVPEGCPGFFAELWGFPPELFSVGFRSPSGEIIPRIPARLGQMQNIPLFLDRTHIELYYEVIQSTSGSQLIFLRFVMPTPGIWTIQVYASGNTRSEFHLWLPISGFVSSNIIFLMPDPYTTITAPGNSPYVITAGAYDAYSKSIYLNSGRGYTRNQQVKPDLCAPGVKVSGPGIRDSYVQRDGTSVAAALTAGSCALLMEWGQKLPVPRYLSTYEIKNLLIRGAIRNPDLFYPNREWGYGTLDVYQVFRAISTT